MPLLLEFFFPGVGHLIMNKYKLFFIKTFLLITIFISVCIDFHVFKHKKDKTNSNINDEDEVNLINISSHKKPEKISRFTIKYRRSWKFYIINRIFHYFKWLNS